MASISDTEDGWATLDGIPASSDDESSKQGSEKSTPDLQSKVDALQEKTDLLQLQIKLKDDSIKSLTDRVRFLETLDRHAQEMCVNSTQAVGFPQTDVSTLKNPMKNLESQSNDRKSSTDVLADSVNRIEVKAKCLEDETIKRLDEQTDRVNALETHLESLIDETDERVDEAMDEIADLRSNVERIKKDVEDRRIDSEESALEDRSNIDAIQRDVKSLQCQSKDYKSSIDVLTDSVKDMESKAKRFERKADHIKALGSAVENLEKCIKALDAKIECFERREQAIQCQTQMLMEGLRTSINDALTQTYADFSGLAQRVKILEGSRQNGNFVYTATMLNQENRARNWEAQAYGLQNGTGYGVFVPSYVNGSVRR